MKKRKMIFFTVTILGVILALFFVVLEPLSLTKRVQPPASLPTPTPITVPPSTRSPNVLPQDLRNAEIKFLEQTPILQKLPARSQFFSIEYVSETNLIVHSKTDNKQRDYQEARFWFAQNNIDINNIFVEYK